MRSVARREMLLRQAALLLLVVLPGLAATGVSGYYLLRDWAALNRAFARFERLVAGGADLWALFVAEAYQNSFRINCFAEGVGVLLGAILFGIGVHGLCTLSQGGAVRAESSTGASPREGAPADDD